MPGDPSKPLQQPTSGPGAHPDNAVWDPKSQTWVQPGESTGMAAPYGGPTGAQDFNGGPGTAGQVGSFDPHVGSGADWGGYIGTNVVGPDGQIHYDATKGGVQADISRFQNLAGAAANRPAYQTDYSQANYDASMGAQDRGLQDNALNIAHNTALGGDTAAQQLGRNMLQQGVQSQQAVAMSARGGSLAQAAALHQQQAGQGAFMQQGNNQLAAQKANEMAAARDQYAGIAGQQRAGDTTAQGLHQQQAIGQMQNELGQRQLNQTGQLGYEQMGQNVDNAAQNAALANHEMDSGIDAAASARATASAQRDAQQTAATAGAVGSGLVSFGSGPNSPTTNPGDDARRKRDEENATSDMRAKVAVRPMGLAAAAARRGM